MTCLLRQYQSYCRINLTKIGSDFYVLHRASQKLFQLQLWDQFHLISGWRPKEPVNITSNVSLPEFQRGFISLFAPTQVKCYASCKSLTKRFRPHVYIHFIHRFNWYNSRRNSFRCFMKQPVYVYFPVTQTNYTFSLITSTHNAILMLVSYDNSFPRSHYSLRVTIPSSIMYFMILYVYCNNCKIL